MFEGALAQAAEGDYRVILVEPVLEPLPTATFPRRGAGQRVRADPDEPAGVAPGRRRPREGSFTRRSRPRRLVKDLPKPSKVPLDTDPPIPLWNTWPVLGLFLALITLEWVLRKRRQMV